MYNPGPSRFLLKHEILSRLRVKGVYVGICGSDLHYYFDGANGSFVLKEALIPGTRCAGLLISIQALNIQGALG
jgi:threonine dehydrogenase-like Zn-dependent dehydrogenase